MNISENIAGMDNRLKQLDNMVDKVCEMLRYGYALFIIEEALGKLVRLAETYFMEEEKLMRRYRYENLESHIIMHKSLFTKLTALQKKLLSSSEQQKKQENKKDLLEFLETDFRGHKEEDSKAWEGGQVDVQDAFKRLNEHAILGNGRPNLASEHSSYGNAVMTLRGIFKYSLPM